MSRISAFFSPGHRPALIAYLTVGFPTLEATTEAVPALAQAGCDMVELGIPFSDPLADGTTIQRASYQALSSGVTPQLCLEMAAKLRQRVNIPLIFMTYYNPVLSFNLEAFCSAAAEAGVDGLIIPDLPPEEGAALEEMTLRNNLDLIYLLAPTTTNERIELVAQRSRGFIYLVSLTGVTGARKSLPPQLEDFIARVRRRTTMPLCVGFGISNPEQAQRVAGVADGVIMGSRLIELLEADHSLAQAQAFISSLRQALG